MGNSVSGQQSEGKLIISNDSSVVNSQIPLAICPDINFQTTVRVTSLGTVSCSQTHTDILEGFIAVERTIEIPLAVPFLEHTMVIVYFKIIVGFDFGIDGPGINWEPKFDFIGQGRSALVAADVGLDIDCTSFTLSIDLESVKFLVDEVISDEGVGLSGEVSPGFNFDTLRLRHCIQLKSNKS